MADDSPTPGPGEFILAMEQIGDMVAFFSEVRQRYITAGWSDHGAEIMTHALFQAQAVNAREVQHGD